MMMVVIMSIDKNSSVQKDMSHDTDKNISLVNGPHSKFSRGNEMYALQNEFTMVTEKKFICSSGSGFAIGCVFQVLSDSWLY